MENKNDDKELEKLIRASMELQDTPSPELNAHLKESLYKKEAVMRRAAPLCAIPLWFAPMILNFVTFSLFAVFALLVIENPYIARLIAGICAYIGISGIFLTAVGVKRTNMKEAITVHVQKRGILI